MHKMINSTLSEICLDEKGSIISGPFGSNISSKYFIEDGIPVIRGNNLSLGQEKYIDEGYVFVSEEKANELKCDAYANDLIFTAAGTIGQVGIIPENSKYKRYVISNKQIRARIDPNKVDCDYAYYWFSSPWVQKGLIDNNKGSTVPLLTLAEVKALPIQYPESLTEQKRIANILNCLSSTISCLKKECASIENIMKDTYSYWFEQFNFPDKEGRPYKLYGGKMERNEELNREIPYGWSVKRLGDLIYTPSEKYESLENVDTIDLSVMPQNTIILDRINQSHNFTTNLYRLNKGDILFGSIRPYLKKAGIAPCDGAVAGTVHSFRSFDDKDYNYAAFTMFNDNFYSYACNSSSGTKMPVISADSILSYPVPYNEDIVKKYSSLQIIDFISSKIETINKLYRLYDYLLPLLMGDQVTA